MDTLSVESAPRTMRVLGNPRGAHPGSLAPVRRQVGAAVRWRRPRRPASREVSGTPASSAGSLLEMNNVGDGTSAGSALGAVAMIVGPGVEFTGSPCRIGCATRVPGTSFVRREQGCVPAHPFHRESGGRDRMRTRLRTRTMVSVTSRHADGPAGGGAGPPTGGGCDAIENTSQPRERLHGNRKLLGMS